jgi:hypothetical protein
MRAVVRHRKTQREAMQIVDAAFDDVFKGLPIPMLQITNQSKSWNGPLMTFSLTAAVGFLQNPIKGTVEVTGQEIIIDADLGFLERLVSKQKLQTSLQGSFQRLLLPGKTA